MPLATTLLEYVSACFTGLWIESHEHEDALAEIAKLSRAESWDLVTWDIAQGLQVAGRAEEVDTNGSDPLAAIRSINAFSSDEGTAMLVLTNFHRFLQSAEVVQNLARQIQQGKQNRTFIVILSPVVQIPTELEKLFVVIEHELPTRDQLEEIATGVATEDGELPKGDGLATVLDAASGLTRYEAEGAFSLSLVRHQAIRPETVWELKSQMLKKSGLVSLHRGGDRFNDLGGLDSLKSFCLRAMRRQGNQDPLRRPRGVMLLGVPGTGKSAIAKALGNETNRPTLCLDIGTLMGSLVGQTEGNIRQALRIVDAMEPCVCFLDELDKGLSGVASSGQSDSGVTARLFGAFLTWLNDHQSDVFVVCTCNDITKLPPEFSRAERFDGIFFLDLPSKEQRERIWSIHLDTFGLDANQAKPNDEEWTGAEIRSCCRLAALLDVPLTAAAQNVVPVARTAAESVERLRTWASGRCLDADQSGMYQRNAGTSKRRKISLKPSEN
ncbi:MAG: AAA family ATPase [Planctomycetes bacterium]|nr:AAA family ATPase [Planctomycetota bacterium]